MLKRTMRDACRHLQDAHDPICCLVASLDDQRHIPSRLPRPWSIWIAKFENLYSTTLIRSASKIATEAQGPNRFLSASPLQSRPEERAAGGQSFCGDDQCERFLHLL